MIAVIADDFTGAAELAGISLRFGLKVILCIDKVPFPDADTDVLIVSTDSRSLSKAEALQKTEIAFEQALRLHPSLVYKKIDSVLRGYVLDELRVQMNLLNKSKAFILPANPLLGRTILNGTYYVHGRPISDTGFAHDPEFPITDSSVTAILQDKEVLILNQTGELPGQGIVVGEAEHYSEVKSWAEKLDESYVLAGAGDFYEALLQQKFHLQPLPGFELQLPLLYVCGTSFGKSVDFVMQVFGSNRAVLFITRQMLEKSCIEDGWLQQCKEVLYGGKRAIIAFSKENIPAGMPAVALRAEMAKAVKAVVEQNSISELFIEGGSTAMAILEELKIFQFLPVNELRRGVVRMQAGSFFITVKPGSYELPIELKQKFLN